MPLFILFGSWEKMIEELKGAALSQFGSGWAWLIKEDDHVRVLKTANADTPFSSWPNPLFAIDVWGACLLFRLSK